MQRLIALLIMVIPGILGVVGIKLMRDVLFGILHNGFGALWLQFFAGFILFVFGLAFVGGFIFYRDRKRNKVQTRFQKK
ncbi:MULTISPECIES: DUF2627 domain-containing protein [Fictibacillus]|uniref:DUF2627 domain-containing protein n=1 Tax=Fictibacillus terranigra TaxID=3058424 RepID=A0ABT8E9U8_9BACL|nr:DUF2627 domain-containing protein [Fictibacillus sp. CENA-BCM004]MDN4074687.1 DUF2627 domain-containing protein [Fictibacillus sp. CENA-BCM004]